MEDSTFATCDTIEGDKKWTQIDSYRKSLGMHPRRMGCNCQDSEDCILETDSSGHAHEPALSNTRNVRRVAPAGEIEAVQRRMGARARNASGFPFGGGAE